MHLSSKFTRARAPRRPRSSLWFAIGACGAVALAACDDAGDTSSTTDGTTSSSASTGSSSSSTSTGSSTSSSTSSASSGTGGADALAIDGKYQDEAMFEWTIADDLITLDTSLFHVQTYDNAARFIGAQNDAANPYNPNAFSRFDWTFSGADLYVCQTAYDKPSLADALATPAADGADLVAGCGGFPWSKLTPIN